MELFQILDCSTLGTCCKDYSIVGVLAITKRMFSLIQIAVPLILVLAATIQFVQLTINPELKDGLRRVINKFTAAVIIFMLPTLVDALLMTTSQKFTVSACWKQVKTSKVNDLFGGTYMANPKSDSESDSVWLDPDSYKKVNEKKTTTTTNNNSKKVSAKQNAIVAYAKKFVNKKKYKYQLKGTWDCSKPYTPTDCSGFVKCVIKNTTGVSIHRKAENIWKKSSKYADRISEKNIQAGDIIVYSGSTNYHVGIYTGHGKEIIHNKGPGYNIVKDSNYNTASKHGKPIGFLRIKGVKE